MKAVFEPGSGPDNVLKLIVFLPVLSVVMVGGVEETEHLKSTYGEMKVFSGTGFTCSVHYRCTTASLLHCFGILYAFMH